MKLVCFLFAMLLGAWERTYPVSVANAGPDPVSVHVRISDETGEWTFELAPGERRYLGARPDRDAHLLVEIRTRDQVTKQNVGYLEPSWDLKKPPLCLVIENGQVTSKNATFDTWTIASMTHNCGRG